MTTTNHLRVFAVLAAMLAAALVAVIVAYGSASAQSTQGGGGGGLPTVVRTFPADGATNVDRDTNIKAKFSEAMMKSSINSSTFVLQKGGIVVCCGDISYNKKKKTATYNPNLLSLEPHTQYTAIIEGAGDSDSFAVKDRAGNEMAQTFTWTFTTGP